MRLLLFPLLALTAVSAYSAETNNSLMTNGDFESGGLGTSNSWTAGKGASIEDESGNHFLRLQATEPGLQVQSYRKIKIPGGTPKLNISFRVRYEDIAPGTENWHTGRIVLHFKDATGAVVKPDPKPFAFKGKSDGWVEKSVELDVPEGATELEFLPALFQVAQGTLDLDDVIVAPAD